MASKSLTPRQQQVYDFLREHLESTGMPPTRMEIAKELGFRSANSAEEHLKALSRKGVIEILSGTSRGIRLLLEEDNNTTIPEDEGLPLIGRVAAGEPILAQEHIESTYHIDPTMFTPQAHFLLKVYGMSMKDVGIMDGDMLAVHRTKDVRNGQIVVARIDDEVTVKRLEKKGSTVYLHPENEELSPIVVDLREQSLDIEGIAVGIIRNNAWM
ncbi:repressor LexA [Pasteurellaceae bacterium HPA106]|uniref:transcriptional repressor LexA n=1 Tax=Spirabiliibacterium pneumoniae TaxID=221400 RepID=UPI001F209528|nr:repressor LexA [Spirabiliibacterium pneumoniae]